VPRLVLDMLNSPDPESRVDGCIVVGRMGP
jgi:hypothetical protein